MIKYLLQYRRYYNIDISKPILIKDILKLYDYTRYNILFYTSYIEVLQKYKMNVNQQLMQLEQLYNIQKSILDIIEIIPDHETSMIIYDRYINKMTLEELSDKYYYCIHTIANRCNKYLKLEYKKELVSSHY